VTLRIGHRGAAAVAPENTIASFRRAVELGPEAMELDVQRTKDGHLVVMHDDTADRTTDGTTVNHSSGPPHERNQRVATDTTSE
jgi:glycerophosphoryl diester phosphodiesterase